MIMKYGFILLPMHIVIATIINTASNMLTYILLKKELTKEEKNIRNIDVIEKEYEQTLSNRFLLGSQYRKARYTELLNKSLYSYIDNMLKNNQEIKVIDTNDIYMRITQYNQEKEESLEEQILNLENYLKKYLCIKIMENYNNKIEYQNLEVFNTEELIEILLRNVPKESYNTVLTPIIHTLLNFISILQDYVVVWFEEQNEKYINNPDISYYEDKVDKLCTHKKTDYLKIIEKVYQLFINLSKKKDKTKTKK